MLAVAPMDAGRPWGLLSSESSMMDTARAWIPPASPTALAAERQAASPTAQSLPGPRGSLATRRRQPLAPHRRNGSSVTRGGGNWQAKRGGGGGGGGGNAIVQAAPSSEGGGRPGGGVRRARASAGVDGCNGDSHPRSQERASRDEDGDRANVGQRGSNSGGGGGARGMAGCSEAWGVATAVAAARTPSDRMHIGGAGFGRGGKSSSGPEVWAWAGTGGGAARGKAMLNAYGLQTDKHNPTCPRGTPGENAARHGRWQRNQDGGGARKVESGGGGGGGGGAGNEGGGDNCRGSECGVGHGPRRSSARVAGSGRSVDKTSDRVSGGGQGHRFRVGKGRKHRPSAVPQDRPRATRDRCPSEDRGGGNGWQPVGDAAAEGCDGVVRGAGQAPASSGASTSEDHRREGEEDVLTKRGSREQFAPQDLLVRPRGTTASPHHPSDCSALPSTTTTTATTATSGHAVTLSMDGRGGSAAPPHRPSLTAAVSTSYVPVLPDLATAIGTGAAGGAGMITAFDTDGGCGDAFGEGGGGGGGDDHSTPPVSRQRSHSHHSPWQARKHPRGFPGGRVGRHHQASHHQGHPHERSLVEERPRSGSTAGRIGSCFSSESAETVATVDSASSACAAGAWVAGASATTALPNAKRSVDDGGNIPPPSTSDPRESYGRPTSSGNSAPSSRSATATVVVEEAEPSEHLGVFDEAGRRRRRDGGGGDLDPFDRLLHLHNREGGGILSSSVVPQSELIDHFKLATRPTSRRGTRKPGSGEGGDRAGGDCTPEPAFCLFSRGVGGAGSARQ